MHAETGLKVFYIILILICATFFLTYVMPTQCHRPEPLPADTIRTTDTIPGDSVPYVIELWKEKPVPVYEHLTDTIWKTQPIDTLAILQQYFTSRHYDNVLKDDSSAFIRLLAHVYRNELYFDSLYFQNRRATIINTYTAIKYQRGIFAGVNASNLCLAPSLYYSDKQWLIGVGYDLKEKGATFTVAYKIKSLK